MNIVTCLIHKKERVMKPKTEVVPTTIGRGRNHDSARNVTANRNCVPVTRSTSSPSFLLHVLLGLEKNPTEIS